jgi:hypothetical protein
MGYSADEMTADGPAGGDGYVRRLAQGGLIVATACIRTWHDEYGVPVRTTVGLVRKWPHQNALENVPDLAPFGIFGKPQYDEDDEAARAAYVRRLNGKRKAIFVALQLLHYKHDGAPLCLLCWEPNPADCHRSWAADWFGGEGIRVLEAPGHMLAEPAAVVTETAETAPLFE